jgi:hypothetical protein
MVDLPDWKLLSGKPLQIGRKRPKNVTGDTDNHLLDSGRTALGNCVLGSQIVSAVSTLGTNGNIFADF